MQELMRAASQRGHVGKEAKAQDIAVSTIKLLSIKVLGDLSQSRPMQLKAKSKGLDLSEAPEWSCS